ncbi:MAG: DUF2127 domain-containing protein [Deltaproteobacteria bacterium]|nr:DUF2127 domain-containing protein [Deltaproteobacteria bacterium]
MQKHSLILKIIIVEKLFLGVLFAALSFSMLTLLSKDMMVFTDQMIVFLNLDIEKNYVQDILEWLIKINGGTIVGISAGMLVLGVLNLMEAYGLHRRRRWAEWLTVIATSLFIPLELYEVIQKQTSVRVGALVLNVAIVYYLAKHKELFPKKMFRPV